MGDKGWPVSVPACPSSQVCQLARCATPARAQRRADASEGQRAPLAGRGCPGQVRPDSGWCWEGGTGAVRSQQGAQPGGARDSRAAKGKSGQPQGRRLTEQEQGGEAVNVAGIPGLIALNPPASGEAVALVSQRLHAELPED